MVYEVPLATQKVKPHQVTALHLITALALILASSILLMFNNIKIKLPDDTYVKLVGEAWMDISGSMVLGLGLVIIFLALFKNKWLIKSSNSKPFRIIEIVISIVIAGYFAYSESNIIAATFCVIAAALVYAVFNENSNKKNLIVSFSEEAIKLPMGRRTRINWTETENVLLRHGTLTINGVNNSLYQQMTAPNEIDKDAFESFCATQIEKAKPNRRNDDW